MLNIFFDTQYTLATMTVYSNLPKKYQEIFIHYNVFIKYFYNKNDFAFVVPFDSHTIFP